MCHIILRPWPGVASGHHEYEAMNVYMKVQVTMNSYQWVNASDIMQIAVVSMPLRDISKGACVSHSTHAAK